MASQIRITFTSGSLLGEERVLALDEPAVLGRSHSAAVRLKEPDVSGKHIEFRDEVDGVSAFCLSRNGFTLNGSIVAEGESRKLRADDVLTLGARVRLRVDTVIAGSAASFAADDEATFATRAYEPNAGATVATQFARPDDVAPSGNETFATVMADAAAIAQDSPDSLQGSMEETPLGDADSMGGIALAHAPRPTSPADEAPTQDEHDAETAGDVAVDFGVNDDALDAQTTGADTGLSDGETVEMKTRQASMDEIFRMKRMLEAKKRFRTKLVLFSALVFFVVLGTVTFVNWPREEQYLSHPKKSATGETDISQYIVRAEGGGDIDMVVDYPNSPRMAKEETASGIEVSTATGKRRDVPFRLSFLIRDDFGQLKLSLEESAAAVVGDFQRRGYTFFDSQEDTDAEDRSRKGILFFEREYRGACQAIIQAGTRFFRSEYMHEEGGMKWHGILILLRDRTKVYRLMREIPHDAWPRGKYLLRSDPNLGLYSHFLSGRWESPGTRALVADADFDALAASARADINRGRIGDWPRIGKYVDTMMVMSFTGSADQRKTALELLKRLRKEKVKCYNMFKTQYDIGLRENDGKKTLAAFEACRGAFGNDMLDLRSRRINDPKEWSCQRSR